MADDSAACPEKGKAPAWSASVDAAPVTIDHLMQLIEAVNKQEATPAPVGIKHTTSINRAIALENAVTKYQKLGKAIEPRLHKNGSNFPVWRASLATTVGTVFELPRYFDVDTVDSQLDRGRLVGILVKNSVHPNIVPDIQGKQG
ncbi:hypothetical protein VP01_187g7 [Puccinia sorghi]|uniref:Uncharacterized protein n=1 Tax=Puccinia sorghi TaxID=27349 RepID=A0A0L6VD70_9BASI|nr:hypothetical protein VP01_187g7 [Puccinia sorghi]